MKSPLLSLAVAILCSVASNAADTLTAQTFKHTISREVGYRYLLHLPPEHGADAARLWPLIVFLHGSGERGDAVAEEARAVDEITGFEFACRGLEEPAAEVVVDAEDVGVFLEGAAEAFDLVDEGVADGLIIDNAFLWDAEGSEPGSVGLDLAELGGI